jgi:Recombinase
LVPGLGSTGSAAGRRLCSSASRLLCRSLTSLDRAAALAAAKARGQTLGNPRLAEARATVNAIRTAGADTFAVTVAPVIAEAQAAGAKSLRQIAAALNGRGIATARGGKWEATTVRNILKRAS